MNTSDMNNRELEDTKSLEQIQKDIEQLKLKQEKLLKKKDHRSTFLKLVTDSGYGSPTEYLIELGYIPNPSVKKSRVKITDEVRQNIVNDLTNKVSTKDISSKYGVTEDSVYNIKGKNGLTKPKTKKVPTTTVPIPSESVSPSSVVNPTDFFESPELKKEVA